MIKIRIVEFISFSFLLNLAVGASAEIYTSKQDCLVKNGSDASWLCDNLVYDKSELVDHKTEEVDRMQKLDDSGALGLEKDSSSATSEKEAIKTTEKETDYGYQKDKHLEVQYQFEYCRGRYNGIPSHYSESKFSLDFPQCQELIPALRAIYADVNHEYCRKNYEQIISNYYLESKFRIEFPQCQGLIPRLGATYTYATQEYCRKSYKQLISSHYSESKFSLDFPQCQELIPALRTMYPQVTNQLLEHCVSQYRRLSKNRSDLNYFSYLYPECSHTLSSIKNQILKENQDSKPQPVTKELDQKNSKETKGKHVETNRPPTPNKKESTQKTSTATANPEYCVNQYRKLSKNRSDLDYFSSLYPECVGMLPSLKSQILKENQDLKQQPATKQSYTETNDVSTPATKAKPQKSPDQGDIKKKSRK